MTQRKVGFWRWLFNGIISIRHFRLFSLDPMVECEIGIFLTLLSPPFIILATGLTIGWLLAIPTFLFFLHGMYRMETE